jgi:hypothetical protein
VQGEGLLANGLLPLLRKRPISLYLTGRSTTPSPRRKPGSSAAFGLIKDAGSRLLPENLPRGFSFSVVTDRSCTFAGMTVEAAALKVRNSPVTKPGPVPGAELKEQSISKKSLPPQSHLILKLTGLPSLNREQSFVELGFALVLAHEEGRRLVHVLQDGGVDVNTDLVERLHDSLCGRRA